jgi:predicted MFS family arabinose efflux permease
MHGRYAFFRGLVIALIISAICFLLTSLWERRPILLWLTLVCFLAGVLSFYRAKAYNNYLVDHVYRVFYVSTVQSAEQQQKQGAASV